MKRNCLLLTIIGICAFLLVSCSKLDLSGVWYRIESDPDQIYNTFELSEFQKDKVSYGTPGDMEVVDYVLDDDQLTISNMFLSRTYMIEETSDGIILYEPSTGQEYTRDYEYALSSYNEAVIREQEEAEAAAAAYRTEFVEMVAGRKLFQIPYSDGDGYGDYLELMEDGSYKVSVFVDSSGSIASQVGTYELIEEHTNSSGELNGYYIEFSPTKTDKIIREKIGDSPILSEALVYDQGDSIRLQGRPATAGIISQDLTDWKLCEQYWCYK